VNDTRGHNAGDQVLIAVAQRLRACVRGSDTVARIGGDEFVVVVQELADPEVAATIARNILAAMRRPFIFETSSIQITASIGVALYRGGAGVAPQDLLRRADEFLYLAKGAGRDTFHIDVAGP
jgi:diguanylate cyclase (GGDEF)-like protein